MALKKKLENNFDVMVFDMCQMPLPNIHLMFI